MWAGLLLGAFVGLKLLRWTMENITWGTSAPVNKDPPLQRYHPLLGLAVLVGVLWWAVS